MLKTLIFGRGPIATRMRLDLWYCRLEFKLADFWVGLFWKTSGHCFDAWLCLVPCFPIHLCLMWHDHQQ